MTSRQIIFLGGLGYLLLIPFFYHPDLKIIYYLTGFLSHGVVNIYQYVADHPGSAHLGPFVYPPATYFVLGVYRWLISPLAGGNFSAWLGMGNDAVTQPNLFRYLLLMKLPLVAAHLVSGWLLIKLAKLEAQKKLLTWLWFFNPVSIYVVAMMGQIDGLAVLTVIAAVVLAARKPFWAAALLGLGGAIKTFPLLFLPLLALLIPGTFKRRGLVLVAGIFSYAIWIGPYLATPAFYSSTLASGLSQRILNLKLIGWPLIPLGILVLYVWVAIKHRGEIIKLPGFILAVSLIILMGISFHPQWLLWVVPWICWYLSQKRSYWPVLLFLLGAIGLILTLPDKFLSWGLFSLLDANVLFLPILADLLTPDKLQLLGMASRGVLLLGAAKLVYDQK